MNYTECENIAKKKLHKDPSLCIVFYLLGKNILPRFMSKFFIIGGKIYHDYYGKSYDDKTKSFTASIDLNGNSFVQDSNDWHIIDNFSTYDFHTKIFNDQSKTYSDAIYDSFVLMKKLNEIHNFS